MRLTLPRNDLLKQLQAVVPALPNTSPMQIMTHVLIEADDDDYLTLTATDTTLELVARHPRKVAEPGRTTVAGKRLLDICKNLPQAADVTLELKETKLIVKAGRSKFTLTALPAEDFPNLGTIHTDNAFSIKQTNLLIALQKTSYAMADKDVRYYLNGCCFHALKDQLHTVATDGHRLAMYTAPISPKEGASEVQVIVNARHIATLIASLTGSESDITLRMGSNHLQTLLHHGESGTLRITTTLVDGKYPDYNRVIPRALDKTVELQRLDLLGAAKRAALADSPHKGARVLLSHQQLTLLATNNQQEEACEVLEVNYSGDSYEIGSSLAYLIDAANASISSHLTLQFGSNNQPIKITGGDEPTAVHVVMPMRI